MSLNNPSILPGYFEDLEQTKSLIDLNENEIDLDLLDEMKEQYDNEVHELVLGRD